MIEEARYQVDGLIFAVIDNEQMIIPDDPLNQQRKLLAQWEAQGNVISPYVLPIPDRVSRRQFMLQLEADQLLDKAEAWISRQDRTMQISFAESSSFYRQEPKLQEAFASIGYSPDKIDAFFVSASQQ